MIQHHPNDSAAATETQTKADSRAFSEFLSVYSASSVVKYLRVIQGDVLIVL